MLLFCTFRQILTIWNIRFTNSAWFDLFRLGNFTKFHELLPNGSESERERERNGQQRKNAFIFACWCTTVQYAIAMHFLISSNQQATIKWLTTLKLQIISNNIHFHYLIYLIRMGKSFFFSFLFFFAFSFQIQFNSIQFNSKISLEACGWSLYFKIYVHVWLSGSGY